jgi:hypothetical protein
MDDAYKFAVIGEVTQSQQQQQQTQRHSGEYDDNTAFKVDAPQLSDDDIDVDVIYSKVRIFGHSCPTSIHYHVTPLQEHLLKYPRGSRARSRFLNGTASSMLRHTVSPSGGGGDSWRTLACRAFLICLAYFSVVRSVLSNVYQMYCYRVYA